MSIVTSAGQDTTSSPSSQSAQRTIAVHNQEHLLPTAMVSNTTSGSAPTDKQALISLNISKQFDVSVHFDGALTGVLALSIIGLMIYRVFWLQSGRLSDFEFNEAELGLGEQKIKLKANDDDRQIAYKIWVELSTRKIGLKIDLEQDVITEVYDSWHFFFSVTRELIKDVPVRKYQRDSTAKIVRLSIEVLNEGLRPHLTKWQARFRRWYEHTAEQETNASPQEIQRKFPEFLELAEDLMQVNNRLVAYRTQMHDLINKR